MAVFGESEVWGIYDDAGRRKYLNGTERARFLSAADRLTPVMRAFCYVLVFTGCRLSEALALTIHHVDDECSRLTFRTLKRRRIVFRFVPVPETVIDMLRVLPTDAEGRFWPLHRASAWRAVKAVMRLAGISGPMASPKGIRHSFGMNAASQSVPINIIKKWLGHASTTTTEIYMDAVGVEERRFAQRLW